MNYELTDLQEIWRKGDGEMPKELQHVVNAAKKELLLRSLNFATDIDNNPSISCDSND